MSLRLGIDIGGTFTDFVLLDTARGHALAGKVLTTPHDPVAGVLRGLHDLLGQAELELAALDGISHATTLVTNAIIERKGALTGLLTTAGFRDLLEIGREARYDLYDLFLTKPEPLVPRRRRLEVRERIGADGTEREPLDADGLARALGELAALGVESLAVVFLHAYANDAHELHAARLIAEGWTRPGISVSLSSRVAPEIREYERL
ncbi:MAG TPA: hydantoinase/oxoprolinase N-terminal domain-containing protein, partial [Thermomicrobiaceae bacterium]|nr:hydantoinase/oxoprolinase N-terminal domain-containing protein [Thermomicrobiaceae bacterium]